MTRQIITTLVLVLLNLKCVQIMERFEAYSLTYKFLSNTLIEHIYLTF